MILVVTNCFIFCSYSAFPLEAGSRNNQPIPDNVTYKDRDGDLHISQRVFLKFSLQLTLCHVWLILGLYVEPQCCGSGMFIPDPDPDFCPSRSHKFHIIENYFIFEMLKKKIWANFQRIFSQKIVTKLSNIWVWDPGSGKNPFRIPDPGSRGQKSTGSRIRIRNTVDPDPHNVMDIRHIEHSSFR